MVGGHIQDAPVPVDRVVLVGQAVHDQRLVDAIVVHRPEHIVGCDRLPPAPVIEAAKAHVGIEVAHQRPPRV